MNVPKGDIYRYVLFYSGHSTQCWFETFMDTSLQNTTIIFCFLVISQLCTYINPAFSKMNSQNKYEAKESETLVHQDLNQTWYESLDEWMNMLSDFYIVRNWPLPQCKTLTALTSSGRSSSTSFLANFSKVAMAMSLIFSWRWFSRFRHWANVFFGQRNQKSDWALTQKIGSVHQWCWCMMKITSL